MSKENPFEDLPEEFKDLVDGLKDEKDVRDLVAKITLDQAALMEAKANDADLESKREAARVAGAIYREGTKLNSLKVKFCRQVLGDRGKPNGESGVEFVDEDEFEGNEAGAA